MPLAMQLSICIYLSDNWKNNAKIYDECQWTLYVNTSFFAMPIAILEALVWAMMKKID